MYHWLELNNVDDLKKLVGLIPQEFEPDVIADKLADGISRAVRAILIESDYIDKDYRSTYYNFYSKKGQQYRADCVRLHFFDQTVKYDANALSLKCTDDRLDDHYFGYMVLRPTGIATIGRTVLSPNIRRGASRYIITAQHKVHLLGYKLTIHGFPSMDQHVDISVCAHAACWSVLRHYSERYTAYREFLTYDITMMAHEYNPGGLVPSMGLQVAHAERVFQEAGTFPVHIARDKSVRDDQAFYRQLCAYLESGFPLFAAMHGRKHAVALVGYDWKPMDPKGSLGLRYAWNEMASVAVVDDNHLPYLSIPVSGGSLYSTDDVDSFIVALPEKIFYPADAIDRVAPVLLKIPGLGFPPDNDVIIRYFLTTGSAFRKFARDHSSEFAPDLFRTIMTLPFAQFVWVVEFSTKNQWDAKRVEVRAIIDATASVLERLPFWLVHGRSAALVFDRKIATGTSGSGALQFNDTGHSGYSRMDSNLSPTHPK